MLRDKINRFKPKQHNYDSLNIRVQAWWPHYPETGVGRTTHQ